MPDFSSRDIFVPTPQKTRIILSAVINSIKFSEQCAPVVQKVHKKAEDLAQESESLMRERARLETQLAQLQYGSSAVLRFTARLICFFLREKRKADEPRFEDLSKDNETQHEATGAKGRATNFTARDRNPENIQGSFGPEKGLNGVHGCRPGSIILSECSRSDAERPRYPDSNRCIWRFPRLFTGCAVARALR